MDVESARHSQTATQLHERAFLRLGEEAKAQIDLRGSVVVEPEQMGIPSPRVFALEELRNDQEIYWCRLRPNRELDTDSTLLVGTVLHRHPESRERLVLAPETLAAIQPLFDTPSVQSLLLGALGECQGAVKLHRIQFNSMSWGQGISSSCMLIGTPTLTYELRWFFNSPLPRKGGSSSRFHRPETANRFYFRPLPGRWLYLAATCPTSSRRWMRELGYLYVASSGTPPSEARETRFIAGTSLSAKTSNTISPNRYRGRESPHARCGSETACLSASTIPPSMVCCPRTTISLRNQPYPADCSAPMREPKHRN